MRDWNLRSWWPCHGLLLWLGVSLLPFSLSSLWTPRAERGHKALLLRDSHARSSDGTVHGAVWSSMMHMPWGWKAFSCLLTGRQGAMGFLSWEGWARQRKIMSGKASGQEIFSDYVPWSNQTSPQLWLLLSRVQLVPNAKRGKSQCCVGIRW